MTYTAKGTPDGHDVGTAVDYLQSFNAEWPLLKVDSTGHYSGAVNHNLNYFPFHFLASNFTPGAVDEFAGFNSTYGVSSTQLVRSSGSGTPRYYIFRLDLESNFTAPIISGSTTSSPSSSNYVFKLAREGKSASSTDMRDFSLHSETRSPMVHLVNHGVVTTGGLGRSRTVTHGLGYIPRTFVFVKPGSGSTQFGMTNGQYYIVPPPVGVAGGYFEVDESTVYVTFDSTYFSSSTEVSVVVLKDPFNKQLVSRTYP